MRLLGTPENVFADSQLYLNVYIGGLTFLFLYNICTGVFTALGDSRTPLYFLIASSLANIVMDVVFVVCFHMGVGGVAWATFLCQGVASVLAAWTLFRRPRGVAAPGRAALPPGWTVTRCTLAAWLCCVLCCAPCRWNRHFIGAVPSAGASLRL